MSTEFFRFGWEKVRKTRRFNTVRSASAKVKELIALLQDADPEAEVRFMPLAGDSAESDSVDEVRTVGV